MNFTANQVRQLYVGNKLGTVDGTTKRMKETAKGTLLPSADTKKSHLYLEYRNALGELTRSDLIDINKIISITPTDADAMARELKSKAIVLDSNVNSGAPLSGQDYTVRIYFRQWIGMSDEDIYIKWGAVHAYAGMSASVFYAKLAESLAKNFKKEITKPLKFRLISGELSAPTDEGEVTAESRIKPSATAAGTYDFDPYTTTYTGVVVDEVEQDWELGLRQQVPVYFEIQPTTITVAGDEVIWGVVEDMEPAGVVKNGKQMADLEYFCAGYKGDYYRNMGWPHSIKTAYLVDPDTPYNTIDIHYYFSDSNEAVQKSEKTVTILVPKVGATNSVSNVLTNSFITKLQTITGITIPALDTSA